MHSTLVDLDFFREGDDYVHEGEGDFSACMIFRSVEHHLPGELATTCRGTVLGQSAPTKRPIASAKI